MSPNCTSLQLPEVENTTLVLLGALIQVPASPHVLHSHASCHFQVVFLFGKDSACLHFDVFLPQLFPPSDDLAGSPWARVPLGALWSLVQTLPLCIFNVVLQFEHLVKTFKITRWKSFKQGAAVLENRASWWLTTFSEAWQSIVFKNSRRRRATWTYTCPPDTIAWEKGPLLIRLCPQSCALEEAQAVLLGEHWAWASLLLAA